MNAKASGGKAYEKKLNIKFWRSVINFVVTAKNATKKNHLDDTLVDG